MKNLYITFILISLFSTINAQTKSAYISFDKTSHNFGSITQEDGLATVVFEFTNTGAEPVVISNVSASCGCTTPDYTKEPVAPGGKGFVSAAYNPAGRPGAFTKTITVVSNAENNSVVLIISGEVTEKIKSVEDEYPNEIGTIRLDKVLANFATIYNDESKTETINIVNTGTENVTLSVNETSLPAYLKVAIEPATLAQDQKGTITVTFEGSTVDDWDYVRALFYLYLNGTINTNTRISATAIVKERFDITNTDYAPKIEFETTEYDFGTITQGESTQYVFTFKNTGKSDLLIRKTRASCGCTAINTTTEAIAPGKTGTINVVFNSTGKSGVQNKYITVITNDPTQDKILLLIKGTVN